ncbi:enoyl-CoA hydratase/isomerase family protein [Rhodococcus sp. IEGM 1401]|uniref:enoyl-CoA hydratase/isomerase family protein n=1 Tax=unclassified Rhodococcus (in: high G+C Gram-positive bacteria) TaxID=192944 RepID=UPI000B9C70A7|nr:MULTISPECIES: enoyl-CoA hydratase/isomerase family protein [unclassified Rhodococcus (in: high G+C Gram-positive bacteria)]MCZ4561061.1 enoyl-CoA hydratase/isomerase family protein [Rhodococcus sp. IEGM 1401]MDI9921304.1 enoyl-CoA hydratase/isomerase family protein [Rhodococcus sp. IEGM 1372]MDV8033757.1 enoyl-CoA hydratase/isomerase family protein [Rhodococcus sp. IEGM 1414]OZF47942.1 enoyl-CoA hydratase [Rhodococcus sp. 14-1411-2a]
MNTLVVEELTDRVVVTLNREKQRNAIDSEMIGELHEVCALVEQDPKIVILTGQGEHFAGGADINQLRARTRDDALRGINRNLFDRIAALPLPTIAAVRGYALGGGAELSYACDIRIASPTAVFGNPEPGLGIMAAAGASYRLPTLVGVSVAKQVLLGGRTLDAEVALRSGLVLDVVDEPLAAAHSLADRIAKQAPLALKLTKKILDAPGSHPWADDIAQAVLFETEDKQRRMTAFLEKKK